MVFGRPWSVWEPFREAMLLPDRFFIDFGVHFGTLLEPCWAQKSLRNQFLVILRAPPKLNTPLHGFQYRFLIDFGPILDLFLIAFRIDF